ncbi:MAG: M56 family metallopeptidase [Chthoniobacter sp.]
MNHALLLPALLELLAKSALLLVGAAALTAGARRSSAAQRHSLWLAVFAALLLLPLTKSIPPRWHLPGSPAAPVVTVLPAMSEIVLVSSPIAAAPVPPVKKFHLPAPSHLALIAWLAGTMAIVGFRLLGSLQIAWLERRSVIGSSACLTTLAGQAAKEMNLRTPCAIRLATAVSVPCTWGFWRPVVLLPAAAEEEWAEERLLAALRHEFAHVARRDYLARWVALLACALYWPNPLVWLSVRRLRLAQEQACDDLVLRAGTPPADYAALLVETARASLGSGAGWRAAVAMARPSTLEGRVIAIVDGTRNRRPAGRPAAVVGALGMVAFIGASALAQIAPRQAAPTTPAASAAPAPEKAVDGIADGATLGLLPIRSQSEAEDGSVKHFTLHIPIKARPATEIDPADLVVHVLFYDMVDGQKILPTTAAVQSQWAAPPANWSKGGVEELKVEYQLSKPETEAAKNENRKYFGYIVRVYYHGKIQAEASDVPRLLQQFPGKAELLPSAAAPADRELEELSLRAYTIFTQAEKLEGARQFPEALAKMKSVLPLLDRITALNFRWQPQVVAYRRNGR